MAKMFRNLSEMVTRSLLGRNFNLSFDGKRDFSAVFGYSNQLTSEMMREAYKRGGIAPRIVKAFPDSVWSGPPTLYGSPEFNKAWEALLQKFNVWDILHRTEILARLSPYAVILIGAKTTKLDQPLEKASLDNLIFFQPYSELSASINKWDNVPTSPRFMRPETYQLKPVDDNQVIGKSIPTSINAHYSRIIHITQETLENDLYGLPALMPIWDWLQDLRKVVGSSAENFWLTANRGLQVDVDKDLTFTSAEVDDLANEVEEYQHQLRRILRTRGVTIKNLGADIADPKNTANLLIQLISGSTGIPTRILMGSESGHLASTQDKGNWAERIEEYRRLISTPKTLNPFVSSLIRLGVLPESEVWAEWPDAYKQSPLERGQTAAQTARTATNLARTKKDMPELLSTSEMRRIVGLSTDGKALDPSADLAGETVVRQRVNALRTSAVEFKTLENSQFIRLR